GSQLHRLIEIVGRLAGLRHRRPPHLNHAEVVQQGGRGRAVDQRFQRGKRIVQSFQLNQRERRAESSAWIERRCLGRRGGRQQRALYVAAVFVDGPERQACEIEAGIELQRRL